MIICAESAFDKIAGSETAGYFLAAALRLRIQKL